MTSVKIVKASSSDMGKELSNIFKPLQKLVGVTFWQLSLYL